MGRPWSLCGAAQFTRPAARALWARRWRRTACSTCSLALRRPAALSSSQSRPDLASRVGRSTLQRTEHTDRNGEPGWSSTSSIVVGAMLGVLELSRRLLPRPRRARCPRRARAPARRRRARRPRPRSVSCSRTRTRAAGSCGPRARSRPDRSLARSPRARSRRPRWRRSGRRRWHCPEQPEPGSRLDSAGETASCGARSQQQPEPGSRLAAGSRLGAPSIDGATTAHRISSSARLSNIDQRSLYLAACAKGAMSSGSRTPAAGAGPRRPTAASRRVSRPHRSRRGSRSLRRRTPPPC